MKLSCGHGGWGWAAPRVRGMQAVHAGCAHVCMYIHPHVLVCARVLGCACMQVCVCACACARACVCVCASASACARVRICVCACVRACMDASTGVYSKICAQRMPYDTGGRVNGECSTCRAGAKALPCMETPHATPTQAHSPPLAPHPAHNPPPSIAHPSPCSPAPNTPSPARQVA